MHERKLLHDQRWTRNPVGNLVSAAYYIKFQQDPSILQEKKPNTKIIWSADMKDTHLKNLKTYPTCTNLSKCNAHTYSS